MESHDHGLEWWPNVAIPVLGKQWMDIGHFKAFLKAWEQFKQSIYTELDPIPLENPNMLMESSMYDLDSL